MVNKYKMYKSFETVLNQKNFCFIRMFYFEYLYDKIDETYILNHSVYLFV